MITEDYVSFETAKLLKEKGFDISCIGRYSERSKDFHLDTTRPCNNGGLFQISAPTHQMAIKWLRETLGLYITIRTMFIEKEVTYDSIIQYMKNNKHNTITDENSYNKIEDATEAAIKYCLENLIE